MTPSKKHSFVLAESPDRSRLIGEGANSFRKKRTVTEWARNRNSDFQKYNTLNP